MYATAQDAVSRSLLLRRRARVAKRVAEQAEKAPVDPVRRGAAEARAGSS